MPGTSPGMTVRGNGAPGDGDSVGPGTEPVPKLNRTAMEQVRP